MSRTSLLGERCDLSSLQRAHMSCRVPRDQASAAEVTRRTRHHTAPCVPPGSAPLLLGHTGLGDGWWRSGLSGTDSQVRVPSIRHGGAFVGSRFEDAL